MRVLIVGLGSIAKKHINALHLIDPSVEIYALRSSLTAKPWEDVIDMYDWYKIGEKNFDFVIISNPTSEHVNTIKRLIGFNLPLFIEKPLDNKVVSEDLIREIEERGIKTYVACNLRFLHCIKELKKAIEGKRINEVNVYCGSYLPDWRPGIDFRTVYSAIPELGGGVHLDLIHELDYVYSLLGEPLSTQCIKSHKSSLGIEAYDYAHYFLEYDGFYANVELNYYRRDSKRFIEVVCDDVTYYADLLTNSVLKDGVNVFKSDQRIINTYKEQMEFFISCVKNNVNPDNDILESNDILKICLL